MAKTTWNMDAAHSSIEFAVKHMMITTVRGRFKEASAVLHIDEENPDNSSVEVDINAASLDTGVADRDAHLRSADFFDADNHPKLTFKTKRIEGAQKKEGDKLKLTGDLTIRDTTLEVTIDAVFDGEGKDPWGKTRRGFHGTTEIDRRDWGLKWNQAIETGGVLVANKVRIELEVQFVKQD